MNVNNVYSSILADRIADLDQEQATREGICFSAPAIELFAKPCVLPYTWYNGCYQPLDMVAMYNQDAACKFLSNTSYCVAELMNNKTLPCNPDDILTVDLPDDSIMYLSNKEICQGKLFMYFHSILT